MTHDGLLELRRAGRIREVRHPSGETISIVAKTIRAGVPSRDGGGLSILVSDNSVDRVGDIIEPKGWRLGNYQKNPVWLVDHDYAVASIVGRGGNPRTMSTGLVLNFSSAPLNTSPAVDLVIGLLDAGMLHAVSVGFLPFRWEKILDRKGEWTGGFRYLDQDLLEVSWVAVPANPNATLGPAGGSQRGASIDAISAAVLKLRMTMDLINMKHELEAAARARAARPPGTAEIRNEIERVKQALLTMAAAQGHRGGQRYG